MKKKILSLAILVSVLFISAPQNVYAETETVYLNVGKTYNNNYVIYILPPLPADETYDTYATGSCNVIYTDDYMLYDGYWYDYRPYSIGEDNNSVYFRGGKILDYGNDLNPNHFYLWIKEIKDGKEYSKFKIPITLLPGEYTIEGVEESISKDFSECLSFKITPADTKDMSGDSISHGTYLYTSSDENVATVASDGTVTLVSAGETNIHVTFSKKVNENGCEYEMYSDTGVDCALTVTGTRPIQNIPSDNCSDDSIIANDNAGSGVEAADILPEIKEDINPFVVFIQAQNEKLNNAKSGDTVVISSDNDLCFSLGFMKELLGRKDITRKLSYNYKGLHYEITIPKGKTFVLDEKIPWYGPLKLSAMFGADISPVK